MKSSTDLRTLLRSVDHKSYPAYKSLAGDWQFPSFTLGIDHVQGDPFASPSALHAALPLARTGFPASWYARDCSRIALQDHLTRQLSRQFEQYNFKAKGSGKSGLLSISRCGQEVLERSACRIADGFLTVRFHVGFPAFGRTINAGELEKILFEFLPKCIQESLFFQRIDQKKAQSAVYLAEDQEELRRILRERHLTAFVANGSILPRKSGISELPMRDAIPFVSPKTLEQTFSLPHRGEISGMAIPEGITLIVGGGYHGKSTLLEAIQAGVYDHIAGDGREYVITEDTAVKLRAEDGRSISRVDISLFINDLPNEKDTSSFSTEDASGSTSQAAGVMEGLEAGSRLFLIDEDTSATNFMVRDDFMQEVISRKKEPITPFIERVGDLYKKAGVSTIMVAGSSGAFFYVADHILQMDCYHTLDITGQVKALCETHSAPRLTAPGFTLPTEKRVLPAFQQAAESGAGGPFGGSQEPRGRNGDPRFGRDPHGGRGGHGGRQEHMKVRSSGLESFSLDKNTVNVRYLEQLADHEQVEALAYLTRYCLEQVQDGKRSVQETVSCVMALLEQKDWDAFCGSYVFCGLARPRIQELYACLDRFRG